MSDLPDTLDVDGTVFARIDTPPDLACWATETDRGSVNLVVEPAAEPEASALETAAAVVADFDGLAGVAAAFLAERLRDPDYGLTDAEIALLDATEPPFDEPEAVVWSDGTWMLRFAESPLSIADPYGIGVTFVGAAPQAVEDLSDAETV
jgi:hypothetical protein